MGIRTGCTKLPLTQLLKHAFSEEAITEALNLSMLKSMTTIPVPDARQVILTATKSYLVMVYIEGQTLDSCWDSMTPPSKLRVA
jgi:aminoglycoside phosphotransferase (APT) family kinase protein